MTTTVLHVCQPDDGGVAQCVSDLARSQLASGLMPVVACAPGGALAARLDREGVRRVPWRAARAPVSPSTPAELSQLRLAIASVDPDVVHLHSSKAGLIGRLVVRGRRPTVFTPHAWSFQAATGLTARLSRRWERIAMRWVDEVVCVSHAERRAGCAAGIHGATVIPNGIDLARWSPAGSDERERARERLGVGRVPLAVNVARLGRQKGQDLLLDAWPIVRDAVPDAELALVGRGPTNDRLALRAAAEPGVRLIGDSSVVADWLAAANLFVLSSRWEGMSLSVLEAMGRARSVVTTDVAGARESLGEDGSCGAIVAVGDSRALATEVARRLGNLDAADREGSQGRRRAEEHFDLARTCDAVLALYRGLRPSRG